MKKWSTLLLLLLSAGGSAQNYVQIESSDSEADIIRKAAHVVPTARQLNWQKQEITGFLHFGINTFTGKEWGDGKESPSLFNPTALDTDQWVRVAQASGIKLLILTAKHHDGFCLWPTATTAYNIANSPYQGGQGDILKDLAASCKKYGVKIGVYLSPWDRNATSYGSDAYNKMFLQQLTEVLGNYGKIDEVWFDGANGEGPNGKKQEYDWSAYYNLIRAKQPEAVIAVMGPDVRWVGTETGYGRDTEWSVVPLDNLNQNAISDGSQQQMNIKPNGNMKAEDLGSRAVISKAKGLVWYPAETDVSIRPGWFYHPEEDAKVKSPEKLLDIYFNSVGKNGVLLLNIPPNKEGLIQKEDEESLVGWKTLRDAIFKTNLLEQAGVKWVNKKELRQVKAGKDGRYWTTDGAEKSQVDFVYTSKKPLTFNILDIGEYIKLGQRVEAFQVEAMVNGQWTVLGQGTTIGAKRILQLPTTTTQELRIRILGSRLNPQISHIGVYQYNK